MSAELVEFLVNGQIVTREQIDRAAQAHPESSPVRTLISQGVIKEEVLAELLGKAFSMPVAKLTNIDPQAVKLLSLDSMKYTQCVPFKIDKSYVHVALADPTKAIDLKALLMRPILPVLTTFSNLEAAIHTVSSILGDHNSLPNSIPQPPPARPTTRSVERPPKPVNRAVYPVKIFSPKEQVTTIFNEILTEAVAKRASDIHIEPQATTIRVRFRIEGQMVETHQIPSELKDQLTSRIKIIGGMDISERKVPQDGRVRIQTGKVDFNFRINTMPSIHGESIAIRVLRPDSGHLDITKIGFSPDQLKAFKKGISSPSGMVLVTGPTGCGKTTTLYSALSDINHGTEKIATVEDPVEIQLEGITQVQVSNDTGLTFAAILKALLRQDPDVILVGEIRDQETANIAVQAALSGHLVLSTIHTFDAPSGILRLLNMGIEPFMVLTSITTIVAQRLVRKICEHCREEISVPERLLDLLGNDRALVHGAKFFRGVGCDQCLGSGYRGRSAVFEVLELTEPLKELLLKGENPITFKRKAIEDGMRSLRQSALEMVVLGQTTLEEAIASTAEK